MIVKELNLNYFPTHKEMDESTGNTNLSNIISKRGGYKYWSEKLNLPIREGDTFYGHEGEDFLKEVLKEKGYKAERLTTNCLYDFLINDCVRVDCKISKLYHGKNGSFYAFNLERPNPDCDIFILITEDDEQNRRLMIIPEIVLQGQKQVSIGEIKSKWYCYENKYEYLDKYIKFYNELLA